jgi:hypothetical protein
MARADYTEFTISEAEQTSNRVDGTSDQFSVILYGDFVGSVIIEVKGTTEWVPVVTLTEAGLWITESNGLDFRARVVANGITSGTMKVDLKG